MTGFDIAAIALVALSALIALARGLFREILTIAAFLSAALAALYGYAPFSPLVRTYLEPGWFADVVLVGALFLIVYILVAFGTHEIQRGLRRQAHPGPLDRSLGFAFGVARGVVVLALGVLALSFAQPRDEPVPDWVADAQTYPLINATARWLQDVAPDSARIAARPLPRASSGLPLLDGARARPTQVTPAATRPRPAPPTPAAAEDGEAEDPDGYDRTDRNSLDDLIATTSDREEENP
ncbi:MAG: CvpA family protein [Maricaulaceae bacterium]